MAGEAAHGKSHGKSVMIRAAAGTRVPVGYPGNKLPGQFFTTRRHGYKIKRLVVALPIIFVLKLSRSRDGATVGLRATSSYVICKRIRPASFVR